MQIAPPAMNHRSVAASYNSCRFRALACRTVDKLRGTLNPTHFTSLHWVIICNMVRPVLSDCCLYVLSVWRWCILAKQLDGLGCHLVWRQASAQVTLC